MRGATQKRDVGAVAEKDYLVQVLEVFKGGIYMKRVGKNTVHVFSGQGFELGSECGVALQMGVEYLFSGEPRIGTIAKETARININSCTLAKPWSTVVDETFLRQVVQPNSTGQCSESTIPECVPSLSCATLCTASETCVTNAFQGGWCGPCRAWCIPNEFLK